MALGSPSAHPLVLRFVRAGTTGVLLLGIGLLLLHALAAEAWASITRKLRPDERWTLRPYLPVLPGDASERFLFDTTPTPPTGGWTATDSGWGDDPWAEPPPDTHGRAPDAGDSVDSWDLTAPADNRGPPSPPEREVALIRESPYSPGTLDQGLPAPGPDLPDDGDRILGTVAELSEVAVTLSMGFWMVAIRGEYSIPPFDSPLDLDADLGNPALLPAFHTMMRLDFLTGFRLRFEFLFEGHDSVDTWPGDVGIFGEDLDVTGPVDAHQDYLFVSAFAEYLVVRKGALQAGAQAGFALMYSGIKFLVGLDLSSSSVDLVIPPSYPYYVSNTATVLMVGPVVEWALGSGFSLEANGAAMYWPFAENENTYAVDGQAILRWRLSTGWSIVGMLRYFRIDRANVADSADRDWASFFGPQLQVNYTF